MQDLARVRVCSDPHFQWELVLSLHQLQPGSAPGASPADVAQWRADTLAALSGQSLGLRVHRHLLPLVPASSYFPDFLTPYEGMYGFEVGLDAVLSTPRGRIGSELHRLTTRSGAPSWGTELAQGRLSALHLLGDTMRAYFNSALVPLWPAITDRIATERTRLAAVHATRGVHTMLANLFPAAIWHPRDRVLETPYPIKHSVHLDGRGLTLIPSWFCSGSPVAFADTDLPPLLVYPIDHTPAPGPVPDALSKLIGGTRAAILATVTFGTPTTAILRRTGISASQLSRHAAVLRDNGLITEARHAGRTFYTRTPLGDTVTSPSTSPLRSSSAFRSRGAGRC
ncbi:winged helix-turn-helix domain-containing protein [Actinomadura sp. NPDC023710]|uniref:winged helix-turn-helix domain-containing protein n=1 Tax=Actinomadura sp. NPDC023710 TaxID=3158219 RepID=UPI0033F8E00F